jgi:hypothetical protein
LFDNALWLLQSPGLDPAIVPAPTSERGWDGNLQLHWQGKPLSYRLLIKRGLRPSDIGSVARAIQAAGNNVLLATDQITPPLADRLRGLHIPFVDGAGNAYIDGEGLLVYVVGQRGARMRPRETAGRAFQDKGLRVLFALLAQPALVSSPYRSIAQSAGVAHGTVGIVMAELKRLGFVGDIGGRRRLLQGERLLRQWVDAYGRTLRPKLLLGNYRASDIGWWNEIDPSEADVALSGEAAVARLSGVLVPQIITLYGNRAAANRMQIQHRMTPDAHGNVEILSRFWRFDQQPPELAPALLIYADLLATGDARCIEAAATLEEDLFARLK